VLTDPRDPDDTAGPIPDLHGDDALAASGLKSVVLHRAPLPQAQLGHAQDHHAGLNDVHADDLIGLFEGDPAHAGRAPPHRTDVVRAKSDRLAEAGREQDFIALADEPDADQTISLVEVQGDETRGPALR